MKMRLNLAAQGARTAITIATGVYLTRPDWDYSYTSKEDKSIRAFHRQRAVQKLDFNKPGKEKAGKMAANNIEKIFSGMEAAKVLKILDNQPEPIQSWLYFAYSAFWNREQYMKCHDLLKKLVYRGGNSKTKEKIDRLITITLEDEKRRRMNGNHFSQAQICRLIGISPPNWRYMKGYADQAQYIVGEWDAKGITNISNQIQDLLEKQDIT